MSDSILNSTKKVLGIEADYTAFDLDILMHINSVLGILSQLGVGPANGLVVEDADAIWSDFLGSNTTPLFSAVKTFVYLRVRVLFDPPATQFVQDSMQRQIDELTWRISTQREIDLAPSQPAPDPWYPGKDLRRTREFFYNPFEDEQNFILDGGSAG